MIVLERWIISGHGRRRGHACRRLFLRKRSMRAARLLGVRAVRFSRLRLYGRPALVLLAASRRASRSCSATESTITNMAAFLLAWGILNFFWLALLRRPAVAGDAVAYDDDGARSAVAAQVPRADDDGELRRPDDRRYRYRQLSVHDLPGAALDRGAEPDRPCSARCCSPGVSTRSACAALRRSAGARLRRRSHRARNALSDGAVRGLLWRQRRFVICALRRRRGFRADDARPHAVRRLRRRSAATDCAILASRRPSRRTLS